MHLPLKQYRGSRKEGYHVQICFLENPSLMTMCLQFLLHRNGQDLLKDHVNLLAYPNRDINILQHSSEPPRFNVSGSHWPFFIACRSIAHGFSPNLYSGRSSSTFSNQSMAESESSDSQFPGFQVFAPKDEYLPTRTSLSRLQRRAPRPLQLKPSVSFKSEGASRSMAFNRDASSSSASANLISLYQSKDPIPLLSPLVSPAFVESSSCIRNENTAKSH